MQYSKTRPQLIKLLTDLRKNGVLSFEMEGIKISLAPEAHQLVSNYKKKQAEVGEIQTESYSEEEVLNWSSAGIPDEAAAH